MNNQSRDRTGKYGFSGDYGRICKCGHNLGTHTAEPPHICGSNGTGLVDCACMKFVPTPPPEESTLKRRLQEILTGFKHGVQKKQGGYGYEEATHQLNLIIQERERLARIDELEKLLAWAEANELSLEARVTYAPEQANIQLEPTLLAERLRQLSKQAVKVKAVTK